MFEGGEDASFPLEACNEVEVGPLCLYELDRHLSTEGAVGPSAQIDFAHPADAQQPDHLVRSKASARRRRGGVVERLAPGAGDTRVQFKKVANLFEQFRIGAALVAKKGLADRGRLRQRSTEQFPDISRGLWIHKMSEGGRV